MEYPMPKPPNSRRPTRKNYRNDSPNQDRNRSENRSGGRSFSRSEERSDGRPSNRNNDSRSRRDHRGRDSESRRSGPYKDRRNSESNYSKESRPHPRSRNKFERNDQERPRKPRLSYEERLAAEDEARIPNRYEQTRDRHTARPQQSWHGVADWYHEHLKGEDTFQEMVMAPLIDEWFPRCNSKRFLDIACGDGYFSRLLNKKGWQVTGVDIAPDMIQLARKNSSKSIKYVVDDGQSMQKVQGHFAAAQCIMGIQNMGQAEKCIRSAYSRLEKGGTFVVITLHPAFRIPKASDWGFDEEKYIQYRRVDAYQSLKRIEIDMNPGKSDSEKTLTYHRPLSWYINQFVDAGFKLTELRELCSHKHSDSGPRAHAENVARDEFPMFVAFRLQKD
jgi:ubiquinone/menaquinone biosynthesis C-methylase UbiE